MAENGKNLLMMLGVGLLGGIAANYADRALGDDYDVKLGVDPLKPGSGVTFTPGLLGGAALAGAAMLAPNSVPSFVGALGLGAIIADGAPMIADKVVPMLPGATPSNALTAPGTTASALNMAVNGAPYGYVGACGPANMTDLELSQAMMHLRG